VVSQESWVSFLMSLVTLGPVPPLLLVPLLLLSLA
jgi:hypothetical protein